ncbi:MAG TPA: hypothetical protein VF475_16470 [Sphingobium sp.]
MRSTLRWCGKIVLLTLPLMPFSVQAGRAAESGSKVGVKPDFSAVTDRRKAGVLVRQGKLVKIHLFPSELGGPDTHENIGYVTPEGAAALSLAIGTLKRFTAEGLIDNMTVNPEYRGASIVPTRIAMHATHRSKKGEFNPSVEIW